MLEIIDKGSQRLLKLKEYESIPYDKKQNKNF